MKAIIVSFRRGRHTIRPRHFILRLPGVNNREEAKKFANRTVIWKTPTGKEIKGIITAPHGNKGLVRAIFEKGLPGQAINTEAEIQ